MNGVHIDWIRSPLRNLRTLDIRRVALQVAPDFKQFCSMLMACPQLDKLTLDGAGPKMNMELFNGVRVKPLLIPTLRQLVIGDFSLAYAYFMLSIFSAPNLKDLSTPLVPFY